MHLNKSTAAVHSGTHKDPETRGILTPVYTGTSYEYIDTDKSVYPRYFNTPNQDAVVKKLCALEHGEDGLVLSSGMAAVVAALLALLKKGDHAVFQGGIYGGTHHMVTAEFKGLGIDYTFTPGNAPAYFEAAIRPETKVIYIETPSNPLLELTDISAIVALAKKHGIITVIDNTFASPVNQNPIDLGIDVVLHSGTKYLGGHSDIICGAVIASREIMAAIRSRSVNLGGTLNAQTCALLERSLRTLVIRVERQNQNALTLAHYLEKNPAISKVNYPGLESHSDHTLALQQMSGFGGMLSFELKDLDIVSFQKNLHLIHPAMSLGGIESIICSPRMTSHAKISPEMRTAMGISDQLLRLSVGIEDVNDLIQDIQQAIEKTHQSSTIGSLAGS
ncbi:MAG: aminotransferase class I/II-fold pyridoxal phosphate-dependent enzyme [Bacteroidia bacterium]|nr:aminotransferase class I/II-fold pyridoxal phosphate-dependent enzyme [Bacteroidia bacterium]